MRLPSDLLIMNGSLGRQFFATAAACWQKGEVSYYDNSFEIVVAATVKLYRSAVCVVVIDGLGKEMAVLDCLGKLKDVSVIAVSRFDDSKALCINELPAKLNSILVEPRPQPCEVEDSPAKEEQETSENRVGNELPTLQEDQETVDKEPEKQVRDFGLISSDELDALLGD